MKINTQLGKIWFGFEGNQVCVYALYSLNIYLLNIKNKNDYIFI